MCYIKSCYISFYQVKTYLLGRFFRHLVVKGGYSFQTYSESTLTLRILIYLFIYFCFQRYIPSYRGILNGRYDGMKIWIPSKPSVDVLLIDIVANSKPVHTTTHRLYANHINNSFQNPIMSVKLNSFIAKNKIIKNNYCFYQNTWKRFEA